ncbi:MAG: DNA translocase FtsK 4TM domain-containing protein [Clostridia bacterium]|nr:DNA translocase FtsK 4TM domain-containing protein [Clostridia bacterium]
MAMSKKTTNKSEKKQDRKPRKSSDSKMNNGKRFEIFAICAIALSIYLIICVYSSGGGLIGDAISAFVLGIMGTSAYILPFVTMALLILSLKTKDKQSNTKRYVMSYMALINLSAIFQLVFHRELTAAESYMAGANGDICGGFIGALIVKVINIFGLAGSYIILFSAFIILMILLFDFSIVKLFTSVRSYIIEIREEHDEVSDSGKRAGDFKDKSEMKSRQVVVDPELEMAAFSDREIIFNIPEDDEATADISDEFHDPEIKLYDDITSGSEHEEPSEEEKAARKLSDDEKENIDREIKEEIEDAENTKDIIEYNYPPIDLLAKPQIPITGGNVQDELRNNARQLIETLHSFKVDASVVEISQGPTITRYEIEPAEGVRVSQITGLSKDIGLKFRADKGVMVAPVPGKSTIGIEIENKNPSTVTLREVIESEEFKNHKSKLAVALGKDVSGKPIIMDIAKMPHLLIAGATGAGKSVCINTLIISLLYKADPNEVKLVMIDPKQVELGVYNGIPHLLIPVVKDAKKATGALSWAVQEMTERYSIFERNNVRNIKGYNELMEKNGTPENKMASIVIIIDEFADLMMVAPADVENYVCRIAQLARAAGMHLVIATQRPVVKFITGNIKANVPSRISFMVASVRDSQTILDIGGAEKLIGKGDMLYMPVGETSPSRMQCAFVSDDDVKSVVEYVTKGVEAVYDPNVIEQIEKDEGEYEPDGADPGDADELLPDAIDMAITSGQISTSLLQRRFRIGYNRAGSIIDQMEARGIISGLDGNKPRQVLITREQYNEMLMK